MSTWHQCTGEPPRASSVMTPDTEAKVPGSDLALENPDDAKYFYIDEHVERVYPVEPDLSVPPGCVPVKRVSREELSEMYQEKPTPEARCPDCGHACVEEGGSWWCSNNAFACYNTEPMQGHEVWRRWGDTDKAAGAYWTCPPRADKVKWAKPEMRLVSRDPNQLFNASWVLGPLPEPRAPGGE